MKQIGDKYLSKEMDFFIPISFFTKIKQKTTHEILLF